ncbi:MAG: FHA domain-containing protein [Armatimonadetes bacterium]|nr:FHA domain-containing protein [Armatimonadota bacterium]MBS1710147.1 FHA domain-containing protein [Armatimonadota bacterium]MBX3110037.1 FHA domain-containing protein [Fimbriimonadaceae bacterium]
MSDLNRTQMAPPPTTDPNKTQLGTPVDPNRTIMGAPTYEATVTIKPVQCTVCKSFNPPGVMFCVECGLIFDKALEGDAFGAPSVQVPVLVDADGREHKLRPGAVTIGRQADILIEDTRVSRQHAKVSWEGGSVFVEDLGSTNGTMVGGNRISGRTALENGATVSLGGYEMKLGLPGEANKTLAAMSGKTSAMTAPPVASGAIAHLVVDGVKVPLVKGKHTFGRRDSNAIQISDPYVSGQHGEFEVTDDGVHITDTGSTNGTFVNEAKLAAGQKTLIHPGDSIRLGQYVLDLQFAGQG